MHDGFIESFEKIRFNLGLRIINHENRESLENKRKRISGRGAHQDMIGIEEGVGKFESGKIVNYVREASPRRVSK
jgi:hypothetical protein